MRGALSGQGNALRLRQEPLAAPMAIGEGCPQRLPADRQGELHSGGKVALAMRRG